MAEIISKKNNPTLKREEIVVSFESLGTPSKTDAAKIVSDLTKKTDDVISVRNIFGKFGSKKYNIHADVYSSVEDRQKNEIKRKVKKQKAAA